jgi:outer membrane receptor protein involved in Fe transport
VAKFDWEAGLHAIVDHPFDLLDHVTAAEQFAYYPFVQVQGTTDPLHPAGVLVPPSAAALDDFGTGQNLTFGQNRFHEGFSQELRITSPDDGRLRWIGGIYFAQTDLDVMISINNDFGVGFQEQRTAPNIGGINPTVTWSQRFLAPLIPILGFLGASALNPNTNPNALAYNFDSNHNTAYAVFGQLNYDLSDTLELSAALRYDRDERELTIMAPDQFLPVFAFPSGRQGDVREAEFDSVQPKLTLSWRPDEDWTLYGTYAEGFRSGGFNLSGVAVGVSTLVAAGVPGLPQGVRDSYDQEDTQGFELGFKSTLAGGALRFDAALFDTEVENGFTFVFVAPFTAQTTRNIKSADVGLETSFVARDEAPTDRRRLGFSTPRSPRAIGSVPAASASWASRCRRIPNRRRTSVSSIAANSAASATGTHGSTIGSSARSTGSPRISSPAIRCRSSTCGSASRPPAVGRPSPGSTTPRTRTGSPRNRIRTASSTTANRGSTASR